MKKFIILVLTICMTMSLFGCSETVSSSSDKKEEHIFNINIEVKNEKITQEKAYEIMNSNFEHVILDVRTKEEFEEGHIKNAINLPVDNIDKEVGPVINDKNTIILVYCRSGNRSSMALNKLSNLGYTNVKDFGGINDWKYEIVK